MATTRDYDMETGTVDLYFNTTSCFNETCDEGDNVHAFGWFTGRPEGYIIPIVFAMIFIVGIVGNGTLIFTVFKNKNMRNVPNIFIVSLALGDLILLLVSVPFTATIYTFNQWPYGQGICKLNEFLQSLSCGVSVFTLTALSGDRYFAIVDPLRKHTGSPLKRTVMLACFIWCLAFVLAIPDAIGGHIAYLKVNHTNGTAILELCKIYPQEWGQTYQKIHIIVRFLIYFAIPIVIIGVFYALMARILVQSSRNVLGESQQATRQIEARKKVAKLILAFVFVFMFCWLPRHIYIMWFQFDPADFNMFWHVFKIVGFCLSFINSCVNPFALYFLSKTFRKYYNRYLSCCCHKQTPKHPHSGYTHQYVTESGTMYNFNSHGAPRLSTTLTTIIPATKQSTMC